MADRLLLDEMFSDAIAAALRDRGHDVLAVVAQPELVSTSDAEVYAWARRAGRRVLTENVADFVDLVEREPEPGILLSHGRTLRRSRAKPGPIIAAIESWLSEPRDQPPSPVEWLRPARQ